MLPVYTQGFLNKIFRTKLKLCVSNKIAFNDFRGRNNNMNELKKIANGNYSLSPLLLMLHKHLYMICKMILLIVFLQVFPGSK